MTPKDEERADHVALILEYAPKIPGANPYKAFLALANMAAAMIRMIDDRRLAGTPFPLSYNEDVLRRALTPLLERK